MVADDRLDLLAAKRRIFQSRLPAMQRFVALAILDHWSSDVPRPYPSIARLCLWTGLGRSTVIRAIKGLLLAKAIRAEQSHGRVTRYDLAPLMTLPVSAGHRFQKETSTRETRDQCQSDTTPVSERHGGGVRVTPEVTNRSKQEKKPIEVTQGRKSRSPTKGKAKPRVTDRPSDWTPTKAHLSFGAKYKLDVELEAQGFRSHHDAKGNQFVDWNAAFSTWLSNQAKWNRERAKPRNGSVVQQGGYELRDTGAFGDEGGAK